MRRSERRSGRVRKEEWVGQEGGEEERRGMGKEEEGEEWGRGGWEAEEKGKEGAEGKE